MSSFIDMSLEDIIQKKRRETKNVKGKPNGIKFKKQLPKQKIPLTDARLKIISKKRQQITDARDKLAEIARQKDARLKLQQLRMKRAIAQPDEKIIFRNQRKLEKNVPRKERVFTDTTRQVVSHPLANPRLGARHQTVGARQQMTGARQQMTGAKHQMNIKQLREKRYERRYFNEMPPITPILRTVENDIEIIDDPMEEDYVPPKANPLNRKASLQLKIITHNNDVRDRTSRVAVVEKSKSPTRPQSILKKRPMAALKNEKKTDKPEKPELEYRIIVSNLCSTVTGGDIEELFGDVGSMMESRLVRPGTAEVIYKTLEDAQRAVDLYHNRQLDGQPMNCLLVTPRSTAVPSRSSSSSKPTLYSTNSNVEPDISTFHKVLFSNF